MSAPLTLRQLGARLRRGHALHMELREGERVWWFDGPYASVPDDVVARMMTDRGRAIALVEAGDSLFGTLGSSQTWLAARRVA